MFKKISLKMIPSVSLLSVSLLLYIFIYLFLQTKLKIGLLIKATVAAVC